MSIFFMSNVHFAGVNVHFSGANVHFMQARLWSSAMLP